MAANIDIVKDKGNTSNNGLTDCGFCKQTIVDPRMLDCFHTFCLNCLKGYGKEKSAGGNINCPVCSRVFKIPPGGFDATPDNDFVSKLLRVADYPNKGKATGEDPTKSYCDQCLITDQKVVAIVYCPDGCDHMCAICLKKHNVMKVFSTHKTFTLDEKPPVNELLKMIKNDCPNHPTNPLDFYCSDCKTTSCAICIRVGDHKDHVCLDIKKAEKELSQTTYEDAAKWSCFRKETEEFVKRIDTTLVDFGDQVATARSAENKRYEEIRVYLRSITRN